MQNTTNFELQTYEASDIVNVMTVEKSNMEIIDSVMKANETASITTATELLSGTVHALTRAKTDVPVFRFTATSNFTAGDTFVVDGVQVTALLPSGETLGSGAYIIGAEVLCAIRSTALTVYVTSGTVAVAADSEKLGGELPSYYSTAEATATAQSTATAAGVLAQSNSQLISGLDTRVEALEGGQVYNIAVEEAIGTMGNKTVYRKRYHDTGLTASSDISVDTSITNTNSQILNITGAFKEPSGNYNPFPAPFASSRCMPRVYSTGVIIQIQSLTLSEYFIEIIYTKN